ncbi:aquaporin-12-like [Alligator sinensis]|uniref:Aquaporin n=1 Tax=Alligator sinensis TaxID=38654 RepID=A0A1U7SJZ6_ALLSI|nr:aquaporin-12-like [Alligator sinensis]
MAGLNVSFAFFVSIVAICEVVRQISKRFIPLGVYRCLAEELASSLQLCTCCLELRMLVELGPWGGGFGPDVTLTLLFLLFLVHGFSFGGASGNPMVSLQEFLIMESSFMATTVKILAQFAGMEAGRIFTKLLWSWELTDLHLIQNLMAFDCSSSIQTSLSQGIYVEGGCSFFFHLVALKFQHNHVLYRVPVVALLVTVLAYTAGLSTGAFYNPALATAVTFHCSGNTLQEYIQVYWLGPLTGMLIALLLFQGNIPRLFQKNLLYNQRSKYKTPKVKAVSVPAAVVKQIGESSQEEQQRARPRAE